MKRWKRFDLSANKKPDHNGDYWVTDGWTVHMAFWHDTAYWGIYQPNEHGVISRCYKIDDMNFSVEAFCEVDFPKGYERFQKYYGE
jgi:hypothetical protein